LGEGIQPTYAADEPGGSAASTAPSRVLEVTLPGPTRSGVLRRSRSCSGSRAGARRAPSPPSSPDSNDEVFNQAWDEIKELFAEEVDDLKKKLASAQEDANKHKEQYARTLNTLRGVDGECASLRAEFQQKEEEYKRYQREFGQMSAANAELIVKNIGLKETSTKEIKALENDKSALFSQVESLEKELAEARRHLGGLVEERCVRIRELEAELEAKPVAAFAVPELPKNVEAVRLLFTDGLINEEDAGKILIRLLLKKG